MKTILSVLRRKWAEYILEILVIILGILGAFALDNWNEQRKDRVLGQEHISKIYGDLKSDVDKLNIAVDLLKMQEESSMYILKVLESQRKYLEDSLEFARNEIIVNRLVDVDRDKNTWDELNGAGRLNILSDDSLTILLLNFYSEYDYRARNFNEIPRNARMRARRTGGDCIDLETIQRFHYNDFKRPPTSVFFDCWINNEETLGAVRSILVTSFWNIPWFTELGEQAQAIISYMEKSYPDI
jgi:hypothetical protein